MFELKEVLVQKPEDIPKEAWSAAKLAVRAYARDPAEINASQVAIASQEIRQLDVSSLWRQMQCRWLAERSGPLRQRARSAGRADVQQANTCQSPRQFPLALLRQRRSHYSINCKETPSSGFAD